MFRRTIVADVVQGIIVGGLLAFFTANQIIGFRIFTFLPERTTFSGIIQGIIVGGVLAFITANIIMNAVVKAMTTTVNGWSTTLKCGQPGNGILLRASCAKILPMANVAQEAAYWTTTVDSAGRALSGKHNDVLHFPAGQLPPNTHLVRPRRIAPLRQGVRCS